MINTIKVISLLLITSATVLSQDYSKAIISYQEGKINSDELITILDSGTNRSRTTLSMLGDSYLLELKEGEVNTNFFPGAAEIIGGFITRIENEKIRNILGFLFPDNKCSTDDILKSRGAAAFREDYELINKPVPQFVLDYETKNNKL